MAVTPDTGKTHTRYLRLLANGYDLSGDMRAVSAFGVQYDQADATGWNDGSNQWLSGRGTVLLDGFNALFNNATAATGPTAAGAHTVVSAGGSFYNSLFIGIRAAPAIGNPTFSATFEQGGYAVTGDSGAAAMLSASFFGSAVLASSAGVWGVCLAPGTALTGTTTNGSVDNGASSANGYVAFLHIPQTTGAIGSNNWSFVIEHSANDSSFSTLATFTADGSAITAERLEATGTVNRYVRLVATRTAGTARPWVSFIRL